MVTLSRFVALSISLTPKASLSQCLFNVRSAHASLCTMLVQADQSHRRL